MPDGMEASDPAAAGFEPPVSRARDHPYLNKMQHRGGGFALLCAFHFHPPPGNRSCHYKAELIRNAQPYCDEAMEPNYWAGRTTTAGWKSIESLERHKLVYRNSMRGARHAAGYNRGPQDEFALTPEGVSFIQEMLKLWPTDPARGGAVTPSGSGTSGASRARGGSARSAPSTAPKKSQEDERELLERLRNLGLQVEGHPNALQTEYILQISASEQDLKFWATRMGLLMRLKGDPTKNRRHADFGGSKSAVPRTRASMLDHEACAHTRLLLSNSGAVQSREVVGVSAEQASSSRVLYVRQRRVE